MHLVKIRLFTLTPQKEPKGIKSFRYIYEFEQPDENNLLREIKFMVDQGDFAQVVSGNYMAWLNALLSRISSVR